MGCAASTARQDGVEHVREPSAPTCKDDTLADGHAPADNVTVGSGYDVTEVDPTSPEPEIVCPPDEIERLEALRGLGLVGAPPEVRFDSITGLMKTIYQTPVSAITLISEDTIHMHSRAGLWACTAPRKGSFCDWILDGAAPRMLVVEDATRDERFCNNRFVTGAPFVRFYAGCPLVGSTGARLGTLCVIDFEPRCFSPDQYLILCHFAELATRELERDVDPKVLQHAALQAALEDGSPQSPRVVRAMDAVEDAVVLADMSQPVWPVIYANTAWNAATGHPCPPGDALPFWEIFGAQTLEMGEVVAAVDAVNAGEDFTITVNVPDGNMIMRFKPVSEAGQLDAGGMPIVGIPSGIHMDYSIEEMPMLGRATVDPLLGECKRVELAAALAALNDDLAHTSPSDCLASLSTAAAAAAAQADNADLQMDVMEGPAACRPVYYLGVVLKHPENAGSRRRSSIELNNEAGMMPVTVTAAPPSEVSTETASQRLSSLAETEFLPARPHTPIATWDSAASAESVQATPKAAVLKNEEPTWTLLDLNGESDGTMSDSPPEALMKDLSLGAMIGCGSVGRCYRGMWHGSRVAVKTMDFWEDAVASSSSDSKGTGAVLSPWGGAFPATHGDESGSLQAISELSPALGVAHPNLLQTYVAATSTKNDKRTKGRVHRQVWVVQKFADKGPLYDALIRGDLRRDSSPDTHFILLTAREIASAMAFLHGRGTLHGALHSFNVLLCSDTAESSRGWTAQVGDYGLVRSCAADSAASASHGGPLLPMASQVSSVGHVSPEVLLGGELTARADVYAFGVLLWEMWCGRKAWRNLPPQQVMHAVAIEGCELPIPASAPRSLGSLMARCMSTDEMARPTFDQILEELNNELGAAAMCAAPVLDLARGRSTEPEDFPFFNPTLRQKEGGAEVIGFVPQLPAHAC